MALISAGGVPSLLPIGHTSIYSEGWDLPLEYYWDESFDDELLIFENPKKLLEKFNGLPAIPGFSSNCIAVFHDERILFEEDREGLPFDEIHPTLFYEEQVRMGLEMCRYLKENEVKDLRILSNVSEPLEGMEKYLREIGVEIAEVEGLSTKSESDRLKIKPNSTEVTVLLLFYCKATSGMEFQKAMGTALRTAITASRNGVIVLTNVGLLPLDLLDDSILSQLLTEMVQKQDVQLKQHHIHLQKLYPTFLVSKHEDRAEKNKNLLKSIEEEDEGGWIIDDSDEDAEVEEFLNLIPNPGPKNFGRAGCGLYEQDCCGWDADRRYNVFCKSTSILKTSFDS